MGVLSSKYYSTSHPSLQKVSTEKTEEHTSVMLWRGSYFKAKDTCRKQNNYKNNQPAAEGHLSQFPKWSTPFF